MRNATARRAEDEAAFLGETQLERAALVIARHGQGQEAARARQAAAVSLAGSTRFEAAAALAAAGAGRDGGASRDGDAGAAAAPLLDDDDNGGVGGGPEVAAAPAVSPRRAAGEAAEERLRTRGGAGSAGPDTTAPPVAAGAGQDGKVGAAEAPPLDDDDSLDDSGDDDDDGDHSGAPQAATALGAERERLANAITVLEERVRAGDLDCATLRALVEATLADLEDGDQREALCRSARYEVEDSPRSLATAPSISSCLPHTSAPLAVGAESSAVNAVAENR